MTRELLLANGRCIVVRRFPPRLSGGPVQMARKSSWVSLRDERLLKLRFRDLKLGIKGTWLERRLSDLFDELDQRGIRIRPHVWLSDEWFTRTTRRDLRSRFTSRIRA